MGEHREYLRMAIKALEQTSALDKARAEIAAYGSIWVEYVISGHTDHDIEVIVKNVLRQAKEQVLTVIDKYRVESEDKLDGNPVDIDKAIEHYEGTMEVLKGIDLEVDG
jgi:hypothetical protein